MQRSIKIHNQKTSKIMHIYNKETKSILGRHVLRITCRITNNVCVTMLGL